MGLLNEVRQHKIAELVRSVANDSTNTSPGERATLPVTTGMIGMPRRDIEKYNVFRALELVREGAITSPYVRDRCGLEIEASLAVATKLGRELSNSIFVPTEVLMRAMNPLACTRAMSTEPGSKGGNLVSVETMGFIDYLRARSVAIVRGARVISDLVDNGVLIRQTGKPTITWQSGEGVSTTAGDQALGQLSMSPKTVTAVTDVSEQLLRQSGRAAQDFVMSDLAADLAIDGLDNAVINGSGGAQPLGIKNVPGVTTGQDASSANYAKVLAFTSQAGTANAIKGNPGFITNTAGASLLMQRQRFTSTDSPLWEGNVFDGVCVGFPAMSSEQVASGNLIFGSWDQVIIGEWGVLELAMDNSGTRFNNAQVGIRAMWMVDVLIRYPQAFVVSTNLS